MSFMMAVAGQAYRGAQMARDADKRALRRASKRLTRLVYRAHVGV